MSSRIAQFQAAQLEVVERSVAAHLKRKESEEQANARMIAELLEALRGMLEIYGVTQANLRGGSTVSAVEVECCDTARAAIAKATGAA